eukprot:m.136482 g.136482  ORF g.136482 m.136482 type:complete len:52 (-) comp16973_c0_seq5:16-171(-)
MSFSSLKFGISIVPLTSSPSAVVPGQVKGVSAQGAALFAKQIVLALAFASL